MDDILSNIEDYNKKRFLVMSDKKAQQILKDLFIRCKKLNISLFQYFNFNHIFQYQKMYN